MRRGTRTFVTASSFVLAVLLIFAGFLLGLDPQIGGAVRDRFGLSTGLFGAGGDSELQNEVLQKLEGTYYRPIDPKNLRVGAIDGMLASLDDPYTVYMDPEEYASWTESTSGSYKGVGMTVQMKDRLVTVVSTFKDTPAALAGIQEGDVVMAVDGVSSSGRTLDQVVAGIKGEAGSTVVLEMWRPAVAATTTTTTASAGEGVSGVPTTEAAGDPTVDLSQLPAGGQTKEYTLTRAAITIPTTERETLNAGGAKVALITLYSFAEASAGDLRAEVQTAVDRDHVAAIILDLRGNGGGLLNSAVDVASIFIDTGVIVSTEGLHSPEQVYSASGDAFSEVPLYVLTDEYTASASEIVSGALQDYDRATLVGETTFGKGLVQTLEPLTNGGAIKVTTAVYLTPKGRDINKTGISPDVVAPDDPQTVNVDEGVEAALDLISETSPTH
jgi:carboxyl-terminal processing protease